MPSVSLQRARRTMALVAGSCALAACGTDTLTAVAPTAVAVPIAVRTALPPAAESVVDAPISYALEPVLDALERSVARRFGSMDKRIQVPSNKRQSFAFAATRTPFEVALDSSTLTLTLSTVVSYEGRGWYNPMLGPTVSASCGTNGVRPRVRVVITTDLDVNAQWRITGKSRVRSVQPYTDTERDQCRVTLFKIDVTDRIVNALRPQLAKKLPEVDRRIGKFDLHTRVERWYNLLNKSIRIQDSLWLVLAPDAVRLGGLRLEDSALVADVRLFARPMLLAGPRPANITTTLPPLVKASRTVGDSAHLVLEGLLRYDGANGLLEKQLVGRKFSRFGRRVTVRRVRIYPLGDGRVALAVGVDGAISGDAYFVGTPKVDTLKRILTVPDLNFDVNTESALVRGLAWLKKADMVMELRERAVVPLDPILEETRDRVEGAINRELASGVHLAGRVHTGRLLDVFASTDFIIVRAEATGTLGLGIDREINVKRPKKKTVTDSASTDTVRK